jgi:hypothetical protein
MTKRYQKGNQNSYMEEGQTTKMTFFDIRIMFTPLLSFGHCVVCPSSIYGFWLPLWYLLAIVFFVLLPYTNSDYPLYIEEGQTTQWPKDTKGVIRIRISKKDRQHNDQKIPCFLSFFDIRILITPLVSFGHCVVCPSSIYGFWLPLWYILTIVLSVLLRYTDSNYPFGIFWPLC